MREEKLMLSDGSVREVIVFEPDRPVATLQILHGMAEHMKRYLTVADYFYQLGYKVILHNHAGHGFDIPESERGHFESIQLLAEQAKEILDTFIVKDKPVVLFGHSMGSVIARQYAINYPVFSALILSGTSYYDGMQAASKQLLRTSMRFSSKDNRSPFFNTVAIKQFNRKIKPNVTPSDWLSMNEENVKAFIEDPYTGFNVSTNVLYEIIAALKRTQRRSQIKKMNKETPILLVSGQEDAFSNYGKGIEKLGRLYKDNGIDRVTIQLYQHARHEVLFERNQQDVIDNIHRWLESVGLD